MHNGVLCFTLAFLCINIVQANSSLPILLPSLSINHFMGNKVPSQLYKYVFRLLTGIGGQNGLVVMPIKPQFVWQNPQLEIRLCHKS